MAYTHTNRSRILPKRYTAPRRKSYSKAPYKKRRAPTSGRSFAANVKKANISSAPEKNLSVCFTGHGLKHNQWSKGPNTVHLDGTAADERPILFENMLSQIRPGLAENNRIGEQVFMSRMKMRMFFATTDAHPCLSYRIIVYMTPNALPTSTGKPSLLDSNIAESGFNHLLRSVDRKCNHVLYEKLISPNQNGGLTGVATSFIEEINVRINKDITFQSAAHTYGAKGAWTNLHVAILAYDVKLSQYTLVDDATAAVNAERDAAMEIVDHTKQLGLGFTGKSLASKVAVSDLSCEYTIYFKEA